MAGASENDCVFCKIVNGEIPSHKIWEDDEYIAFLSIYPNTKGVSVVASKDHKPSYIFENDDNVITGIQLASKKVATAIDKAFEDVGRCGIVYEGFGVDHLHSKIYPMHGTGKMEEWEQMEADEPIEMFVKYPGYITTRDSKKATDSELTKVAEMIRGSF